MTDAPLAARYRALLFDLDGVLYLRDRVVEPASRAVAALRGLGLALGFITNNSLLSPAQVAAKLRGMGIEASEAEVVTSAQATVHLLGGPAKLRGARVLVIGGAGLRGALTEAGATVLGDGDDWRQADTVVVGLDLHLNYDRLAAAALAISAGARFVGSNPDGSLPSVDGPLPGAGATLALLSATTGRQPEVAGKPAPALFETAARRVGPGPYLMVGDRVDTDLDGARRLGWDTALVLTGVTTPARLLDLVTEPPTWVLRDVGGLLGPAQPVIGPPGGVAVAAAAAALLGLPGPAVEWDRALVAIGDAAADDDAISDGAAGDGDGVTGDGAAGGRVDGALAWDFDGDEALLHGPAVAPAARGRCTATRLLLAAAARLRAGGVRGLRAPAGGPADALLADLGFVLTADGSHRTRELQPR